MTRPRLHLLSIGYNCGPWFRRCLDSVHAQDEPADTVMLMDDASPDLAYGNDALALCQERGYTYVRNARNRQAQQNLWAAILLIDPGEDDVIFILDTDDFLPDPGVFRRVRDVYEDPGIWLTYGSSRFHPNENPGWDGASAYPPEVISERSFRTHGTSRFNHPLIFRKRAWDCIEKNDLKRDDGRWFTQSCDYCIMMPMLEFCSPDHFRFLTDVLYVHCVEREDTHQRLIDGKEPEWPEMARRPKKPAAGTVQA